MQYLWKAIPLQVCKSFSPSALSLSTLNFSYNVTAHVKHVHNREKRKIDEEKLTCKFCGKRFQKIWKVKQHMAEIHQLVEIQQEGTEEEVKYQVEQLDDCKL